MNAKRTDVKHSINQITDPYVFLFCLTLLVSAALTFTIQPMVGKLLLPLVGGTPSGWLVTMVYFQMALLGGYTIAHLLSRFSVMVHMAVVIALLCLGLVMFPLHLSSTVIETSGYPEAVRVLLTLFSALTLPCVALFTLSPSLQRLFEAGSGKTARDPYFLFAASNLGSLGGLLAYPLIIEHVAGLAEQTHGWQDKYEFLIALCIACVVYVYKQVGFPVAPKKLAAIAPTPWRTRGWWLLLAFVPSSLMLGVTAHVTSDLGGVPFFWVLPLALYLVTFIMAFAQRQAFKTSTINFLRIASIAVLIAFFVRSPSGIASSIPEQIIFPLIAFFMTALFCHYTLAASRPEARRLTEFYLWVALGGALGGLFNTFAAPFLFSLPIEFIAVALLSCLIDVKKSIALTLTMKRAFAAIAVLTIAIAAMYGHHPLPDTSDGHLLDIVATVALAASLVFIGAEPRFLVGLSTILVVITLSMSHGVTRLETYRDFFGVLRIFEITGVDRTVRVMSHGSTVHGIEQVGPAIDTRPHAYYEGSLGDLFAYRKPKDVGILGMGAGTILCYQAPGRHYTMYEIDPAVPVLAGQWFDYMRNCGTPELRIGDGRRMLVAEVKEAPHDLLVVDVFTSDAIPLHLLTKEAFQVYFNRLKPNGLLAVHITNHFYDLRQPISNIVNALGYHALYKDTNPPPSTKSLPLLIHSRWVVVARDASQLEALRKQDWHDLPDAKGQVWTDDFSDALSALIIFQPKPDLGHAEAH